MAKKRNLILYKLINTIVNRCGKDGLKTCSTPVEDIFQKPLTMKNSIFDNFYNIVQYLINYLLSIYLSIISYHIISYHIIQREV